MVSACVTGKLPTAALQLFEGLRFRPTPEMIGSSAFWHMRFQGAAFGHPLSIQRRTLSLGLCLSLLVVKLTMAVWLRMNFLRDSATAAASACSPADMVEGGVCTVATMC